MPPTPITIVTGFLGSGKTTLILNLIPQLPKSYKLALLKNEFGDVAVDTQLAASASISSVRELLNGCICCNLVGQLSDAIAELKSMNPDRIVIETSGSAFPATLAMEVNRLGREGGDVALDGVVSVIDVENWRGYEDTSVTARMQAKYTDLIVFNKWEIAGEQKFETCLDRVGDLEVQIAYVKSAKGWVSADVVMGIDGGMITKEGMKEAMEAEQQHEHSHDDGHHQSEVEVLSVVLEGAGEEAGIDLDSFEDLLFSAPRDEVYRIKGLILSTKPPPDSAGTRKASIGGGPGVYVLNWAFSRWTYTPLASEDSSVLEGAAARLTFILARSESTKWIKKLQGGDLIELEGKGVESKLEVKKIG